MTENSTETGIDNRQNQAGELPESDQRQDNEALLQDLMAAVADHDQAALGTLYDQMINLVYGLALRITKRATMAEEVVQDTFWQVWRQAPRYDPQRGSVKAWVMTIARSRSLDALRQLHGEEYELELEAEIWETIPAGEGGAPHELLAVAEQNDLLRSALAALEPTPRQLVSLAFFRGLSHDEIAESSGLPLGTVKSHIRKALQTLQQMLAGQTAVTENT